MVEQDKSTKLGLSFFLALPGDQQRRVPRDKGEGGVYCRYVVQPHALHEYVV